MNKTSEWLQSFADMSNSLCGKHQSEKAITISVTGGKGGVGKTSVAIKFAQMLSERGFRTLLIDCDFNLSNSVLKLGFPINDHFFELVSGTRSFEDALYKDANLHILSGCNGNLSLFENGFELDRLISDIIVEHEAEYDYIVLDSSAGLSKTTLNLNAYSDYRIVVVTPDKSSITDSYSLIKILSSCYGIKRNHLVVNKVSTIKQYERIVKTLSETVENFIGGHLTSLGSIPKEDVSVDQFDKILLQGKNSLHENFLQLMGKFLDEDLNLDHEEEPVVNPILSNKSGYEIQMTI